MVHLKTEPCVTVIIHPVNRNTHPTYPPGFRWAVMSGSRQPAELEYCVGAGHEPTKSMAAAVGESHGAAACKSLRMFGISAAYSVVTLDFDPIPAEADDIPLTKWS